MNDGGHGAGIWCKWALPGVSTGQFAQAEALTWSLVPWDSMEGPWGEVEARWGPLWFTYSSFHCVCCTNRVLSKTVSERQNGFPHTGELEKPGWCSG